MKRPGQAESLRYQFPDTTRLPSSRLTEPALPVRLSAFALIAQPAATIEEGKTRERADMPVAHCSSASMSS